LGIFIYRSHAFNDFFTQNIAHKVGSRLLGSSLRFGLHKSFETNPKSLLISTLSTHWTKHKSCCSTTIRYVPFFNLKRWSVNLMVLCIIGLSRLQGHWVKKLNHSAVVRSVQNQTSIVDLGGWFVLFIGHTTQPHHRDHQITKVSGPRPSNISTILLEHHSFDQIKNKSQSLIYWVQVFAYCAIRTIGYWANMSHKD
jgi:hypothetical protein